MVKQGRTRFEASTELGNSCTPRCRVGRGGTASCCRGAIAAVVLLLTLSACSQTPLVSTCGTPATARYPGGNATLGDCAGHFGAFALTSLTQPVSSAERSSTPSVRIAVSQSLHIANFAHDAVLPPLVSSNQEVLRSPDGVAFTGVAAGEALIVADTPLCSGNLAGKAVMCLVLIVDVAST